MAFPAQDDNKKRPRHETEAEKSRKASQQLQNNMKIQLRKFTKQVLQSESLPQIAKSSQVSTVDMMASFHFWSHGE